MMVRKKIRKRITFFNATGHFLSIKVITWLSSSGFNLKIEKNKRWREMAQKGERKSFTYNSFQ